MTSRWLFNSTLATLATAATLATLASPAGATVIFREDFEAGTLGKFAGKNNPAGRVTVVMKGGAEVVDRGNYAVKVTMMGDERFNAQQLRVQLASINVNVVEGGDTFMSVYMYVKEAPKTRDNFYYYEGSGSGNVMTWWLEPAPGGGTVMKYGTGNLGARGLHWTGNFEVGKWHQLAAHMHWGRTDETGNIRLWFDGVMVLDKKVQTMVNPGRYYSEPGIHRDMSRTGASEAGVDSLYFDNFITADKLEEIELMTPAAGAADGGVADAASPSDAAVSDTSTTPGAGGRSGSGGNPGTGGGSNGGANGSGGATGGGGGGSSGASSGGSSGSGGTNTSATGGSNGGNDQRGGSQGRGQTSGTTGGGCSVASGHEPAPLGLLLLATIGLLWRRRRNF
jgi:MYXO-CTERM domain-containing protein